MSDAAGPGLNPNRLGYQSDRREATPLYEWLDRTTGHADAQRVVLLHGTINHRWLAKQNLSTERAPSGCAACGGGCSGFSGRPHVDDRLERPDSITGNGVRVRPLAEGGLRREASRNTRSNAPSERR
jgi:hypothetical protein